MTVQDRAETRGRSERVAQAQARGMSVEEYVQQVIEDRAGVSPAPRPSAESFKAMLDELAEMGKDLPHLPSSAFSRESIYQDHD